ncbi:MAG: sensor histidine kinase [Clostridium sp.]
MLIGALALLIKVDINENKTNKFYALLIGVFVGINFFISDALVNVFLKILIQPPLSLPQYVIYFILSILLTIVLSVVLSKVLNIEYINVNSTYEQLQLKKQIFLMVIVLFSLLAISISFITYNILNIQDMRIYLVNFILFISYLCSNIIMSHYYNQSTSKQLELLNNKIDMERLQGYVSTIESLYDNLRTFKHDYKNILLTLHQYIESKDIDGLEKYYKENILETGSLVDIKDYTAPLKNIQNIPLKSLLLANISKAESKNINIEIEINDPIIHLAIEPIDLSRILGIFLDNAIEESELTTNKLLKIAIILKGFSTLIVIQNSCRNNIPIYKLTQKGFSTKGDNRGLGLYTAKEIIDKYETCTLNLETENNMFTLELWIRN